MELVFAGEREAIEAAVGAVHEAQAIAARLDIEIRKQLAVDEQCVAKDFGNPWSVGLLGDRILELTIGAKQAVGDHQRNFVFAPGQIESCLHGIANEAEALQPCIDVESVNAHGVVVVEERGCVLARGIEAGLRFAGDDPFFGIAVARRGCASAVKMDDGANFGQRSLGAVQCVVDGEKVAWREFVGPFDDDPFAALNFQCGSGKAVAEAPHGRGG